MKFAADLEQLRDRTLADLDAAHDYHSDAQIAWKIVGQAIAAGQTFAIRNQATGHTTTHDDLARKAPEYVGRQLAEATFQQFVSVFESFLVGLLRLWLTHHPESLGTKTVTFKTVLDAADTDAVTAIVVGREVNQLAYEKPAAWFAYLDKLAALGVPSAAQVERIAEAKATRDVLIHNRGIANPTYSAKAGASARCADGDRVEVGEPYHRQTWELFRDVVATVSAAAIAKVG